MKIGLITQSLNDGLNGGETRMYTERGGEISWRKWSEVMLIKVGRADVTTLTLR